DRVRLEPAADAVRAHEPGTDHGFRGRAGSLIGRLPLGVDQHEQPALRLLVVSGLGHPRVLPAGNRAASGNRSAARPAVSAPAVRGLPGEGRVAAAPSVTCPTTASPALVQARSVPVCARPQILFSNDIWVPFGSEPSAPGRPAALSRSRCPFTITQPCRTRPAQARQRVEFAGIPSRKPGRARAAWPG